MKNMIIAMLLLVLLAAPGQADVPRVFNYQGYISDLDGYPLEGNFNLTFRIYEVASGPDAALWFEIHPLVQVIDGVFSVLLGSFEDLPPGILAAPELWIGVTVGADTEINPRLQVTSTPWAYRAAIADSSVVTGAGGGEGGTVFLVNTGSGLTGGPITGSGTISVPPGGINNSHLTANSVTSLNIVGNTITDVDIATDGVGQAEIAAGAVGTSEIMDNSVRSLDIKDEPGVSQNEGHPNNPIPLTGSGQSFISVSITVPTSGYVMVTGQAGVFIRHTLGTMDNIIFKLSKTAGDISTPDTGTYVIRIPENWPSDSGYAVHQFSGSLIFPVNTGTTTFHLNAYDSRNTGDDSLLKPNLIAVFYSTVYGAVAGAASGDGVGAGGPDVMLAE